jgi:hypothetical protein
MEKGEAFHTSKAVFEQGSRTIIALGWWLLALAVLLVVLALIFARTQ